MPTQASELLLKANLKTEGDDAKRQAELVQAIVGLEKKRTRFEQILTLRQMQKSNNEVVFLTADRTLETLFGPPKKK